MSLNDLPARELALIDAVCLKYESSIRRGESPPIADMLASYRGSHPDELLNELDSVREELQQRSHADTIASTGDGEPARPGFDSARLPDRGTMVGPYIIGEQLGRGGMGVVFAARDSRLDRQVAIKMLAVEIAKREDLTERFEREARAVAAISHPNIVELFDVGVANGLPYAVMEYLDGELLDERLQRGRPDAEEVRWIGAQIADALATAHQAAVVHRDLKPHNVMLVPRGGGERRPTVIEPASAEFGLPIVKLFDFGLARAPRDSFSDSAEETGDGVILGTPGYMAPEQARGETVTPAADIFSLGCVLYEAFYGDRAFDGRTKAKRFSATLQHHPQPDPIRRRDDVELADLIQDCLRKSPRDRPASAALIARRLRRPNLAAAGASQMRTERIDHQLTRRRLMTLAGGGVAGALVGGIMAPGGADELGSIRSLAVLSLADESFEANSIAPNGEPVGDGPLRRGELLSALLVHELARLSEVRVPPFRPLVAQTPSQFRELGNRLEVDAFLTGRTRVIQRGITEFLELDVQIVSAQSGNQLWGQQFQSETGENLLEQSRVATEIASVIGQRLTSTAEDLAPPSVESFNCLVDGETRADPDSPQGLQAALMCFEKAREVDRKFADPIAGIALTSITLAAQSDIETAMELVVKARQSADEALALDPTSRDANLARAMLEWQIVGHFDRADRDFQELAMVHPNRWQVRHQHGLLQLAAGRISEAIRSLREASFLNPMSVSVKVDWARAHWYGGNQERAIRDAIGIRDRHDNHPLARGLLVDIFEHQNRFDQAAAQHASFRFPSNAEAEDYFTERELRLPELPYGPFGDVCNRAILQTRKPRGVDDSQLSEWMDPLPPMLRLLVAAHPSFGAVRLLPRAREDLLPNDRDLLTVDRRPGQVG